MKRMYLGTFSRRARSLATCFCFARVRIIGTLVPFCVIGNSKEFPITRKRQFPAFARELPPISLTAVFKIVPTAFCKSISALAPDFLCNLLHQFQLRSLGCNKSQIPALFDSLLSSSVLYLSLLPEK